MTWPPGSRAARIGTCPAAQPRQATTSRRCCSMLSHPGTCTAPGAISRRGRRSGRVSGRIDPATAAHLLVSSVTCAGGVSAALRRAGPAGYGPAVKAPPSAPRCRRVVGLEGVAVVVLDQPVLPGVPLVGIDDAGGAGAAVRHLVGLG